MKTGIYKITNLITGKFYIGSAKDIEWRWIEHKRNLVANKHCNPKLQHSWNFYGGENFAFSILEETIEENVLIREQYYLDTFKPFMRGVGYNIGSQAYGGDNITHHPNRDAFVEKMSQICSGENNPMFGRNHSDNAIAQQKLKAKGRFTLPWFIDRYGQLEGQIKYDARRLMLANRKQISNPSPNKGKTIEWKRTSGWLERRASTNKYLLDNYDEFKRMILSRQYSQRELSKKLGMTRSTLQRHIKKIIWICT